MSTLTTAVEFAHESKNMIFPSSGMQVLSAFAQFLGMLVPSPGRLSSYSKFNRYFYHGTLPFTETCLRGTVFIARLERPWMASTLCASRILGFVAVSFHLWVVLSAPSAAQ